jgi:fucose 4-O-acetylase-like acetyltransferase
MGNRLRPNYLDYSKAIGIWIVVFGHYAWYLQIPFENNTLWNNTFNVTLFHMPLFFIISGMLYKPRLIKEELTRGIQTLLTPYLLISVMLYILYHVFVKNVTLFGLAKGVAGILSGGDFGGTQISGAGPLWFIYSLFCIKLAMSIYNKLIKINKWGGGDFNNFMDISLYIDNY